MELHTILLWAGAAVVVYLIWQRSQGSKNLIQEMAAPLLIPTKKKTDEWDELKSLYLENVSKVQEEKQREIEQFKLALLRNVQETLRK